MTWLERIKSKSFNFNLFIYLFLIWNSIKLLIINSDAIIQILNLLLSLGIYFCIEDKKLQIKSKRKIGFYLGIVGLSLTFFRSLILNNIDDNEIILDIGPKTIKNIEKKINQSNTVLWNGPAGYFENENFMTGTISIAKTISKNTIEKSLISILGGGDTLSAINKCKSELSFTHLSTAGGAFLEYLEGKDLPGLSVLK